MTPEELLQVVAGTGAVLVWVFGAFLPSPWWILSAILGFCLFLMAFFAKQVTL